MNAGMKLIYILDDIDIHNQKSKRREKYRYYANECVSHVQKVCWYAQMDTRHCRHRRHHHIHSKPINQMIIEIC